MKRFPASREREMRSRGLGVPRSLGGTWKGGSRKRQLKALGGGTRQARTLAEPPCQLRGWLATASGQAQVPPPPLQPRGAIGPDPLRPWARTRPTRAEMPKLCVLGWGERRRKEAPFVYSLVFFLWLLIPAASWSGCPAGFPLNPPRAGLQRAFGHWGARYALQDVLAPLGVKQGAQRAAAESRSRWGYSTPSRLNFQGLVPDLEAFSLLGSLPLPRVPPTFPAGGKI